MANTIVYINVKTLQAFVTDAFQSLGVPRDDAKICADVLIAADLRRIDSHGIQRLKMHYDWIKNRVQNPVTKINCIKETPTTARLDGGQGMGHVVAYRAMELAIKKAKEHGTGAVSVGNSSHYGIAGYYASMATQADLIGLSMTNTGPCQAPTFGIEPTLGTNPLAIGIPTDDPFPFLLDMATSIVSFGKIEIQKRANKSTPRGWAIGADGELATDSEKIIEDHLKDLAALLPLGGVGELLGGHKGYGLATVVEIFSAALWGSPVLKDAMMDEQTHLTGHFFMAINPASFIELGTFKKVAGGICRELRAAKKAPGQDCIYTAGEKEYYAERERQKSGIPINPSVQKDLLMLNTELNLNYQFNF
jgi:LDH2 family malate/lactate/ureidoglycolate dehydrogenase